MYLSDEIDLYAVREAISQAPEVYTYLAENGFKEMRDISYATGLTLTEISAQMEILNKADIIEYIHVRGCGEEYFGIKDEVIEALES